MKSKLVADIFFALNKGHVGTSIVDSDVIVLTDDQIKERTQALDLLSYRGRLEGTPFFCLHRARNCSIGGGAALVIENALTALSFPKASLVQKIVEEFGVFGPSALLCPVRDLNAFHPLRADVSIEAVQSKDVIAHALQAIATIGFYRKDGGWARMIVPEEYSEYQGIVDEIQEKSWGIIQPGFSCEYEVQLEIPHLFKDMLDKKPCIISAEVSVPSVEFVFLFKVTLEGFEWLIRDLRCVGQNSIPLDRMLTAIMPRPNGKQPIALMFGPDGLNIKFPIIPLVEELWDTLLTIKAQSVLLAFDWLKKRDTNG